MATLLNRSFIKRLTSGRYDGCYRYQCFYDIRLVLFRNSHNHISRLYGAFIQMDKVK